jgi:hypothetical protein
MERLAPEPVIAAVERVFAATRMARAVVPG